MYLENVVNQSAESNFVSSSMLICQLFVGGNFKMVHIVYHPEAFDDRFIKTLNSVCSFSIPTMYTDVTSIESIPTEQMKQTDHILQLIFLPHEQLAETINHFKELFTFYRILIFLTNREECFSDKVLQEFESISDLNSRSAFVVHNTLSGETSLYQSSNDQMKCPNKAIDQNDYLTSGGRLFDSMLGDDVQSQFLGVSFLQKVFIQSSESAVSTGTSWTDPYAKFYYTQMHLDYIDTVIYHTNQTSSRIEHKLIRHIQKPIYSEFSSDFDLITDVSTEISNAKLAIDLRLDNSLAFIDGPLKHKEKTDLYPHVQYNIQLLFVYGEDFPRVKNHFLSFLLNIKCLWFAAAILIGAIILYLLRRRAGVAQRGFTISLMEVYVLFFGGGELRYRHRLEKIFFAIALFASFLFVAIVMANFSLHSITTTEFRKMKSFKDIPKKDMVAYIQPWLLPYKEFISESLRRNLVGNITIMFSNADFKKKDSFLYVFLMRNPVANAQTLQHANRDYDLIQESLGALNSNFFLISEKPIPQRTIDKFNQMTRSIIENGLHNFLKSLTSFKSMLQSRVQMNGYGELDVRPITLSEFFYVLIVYFIGLIIATVVFIGNTIWVRFQGSKQSIEPVDSMIHERQESSDL